MVSITVDSTTTHPSGVVKHKKTTLTAATPATLVELWKLMRLAEREPVTTTDHVPVKPKDEVTFNPSTEHMTALLDSLKPKDEDSTVKSKKALFPPQHHQ